jgi:hypothetical protein
VIKYNSYDKQKIKDTLAFNQSSDVAQNVFIFKLFQAPRAMFILVASITEHKHTKQTNKHTKNKEPIKRKPLKERTKG